ncbi:DUF2793 domain-containing protein [bacterium]|nr:DUF2793 domain-containing protein [bacterium]
MTNKTTLQLLPLIQPAQAQKHVTVNAAMMALDVLVQTSVKSRALTAPPVGAVAGDSYIVADGATGDWLGDDQAVAVYSGVYWDVYTPKTGWRVWVEEEQTEAVFNGAAWTTSADRPELVAALGISATPDDTNRLTVSADATLLTNAGAGHQLKINKATTEDTASLLFQTGYSGRAEMGNVGGNDFAVKVSPDGTTFLTGLLIEAATGRVLAPNGINVTLDAGDPVTPQNGDIWYNASSGKLRGRQAGVNVDLYEVVSTQITDSSAAGRALLTAATAADQRAALSAETTDNKGIANGYAGLDGSGKVPASQLPSYVDSVLEYANLAAFPTTGATGKIYVTLDTNKTYRWSGTVYVEIANSTTDWSGLTGKPTTVAGFGITDAVDLSSTQTIGGAKTFAAGVTFAGAVSATDSQFTLLDNADPSKQAKFDLSGLTSGSARTIGLPDADGTLALNTVFAPLTPGIVPASGGGSTNFLRADGTWAAPPAGSGGAGSYAALSGIPAAIDALDALTPVANSIPYFTAPSVAALTSLSTVGRNLIGSVNVNAARTSLERQDFSTRASFVSWAAGRVPSTGLVMKAAGYSYRYIGSGTAISDLPGWVPHDVATAMHWNADNTGVVSAITAVSAMIDYVNANGGGLALMPAGTYRWAGQMIKYGLNKVTLQGEGNATRIVRAGNQAAAAIKFWGGANNRIRNLLLDCAGYSGIGFFLGDQFSGIEDCECINSPDRPFQMIGGGNTTYGIDSTGKTSDDAGFGTPTFFPIGCYFENCRASHAGSTAFSQKQVPHSRIQRCVAQNIWSEAITIDRCDYSVVSGNTVLNVAMTNTNQFPDLDAGTGYLAVGGGGVGGIGVDGSVGARIVKNTIIGVHTNVSTLNNRNRAAICFVNNIQDSIGCTVESNYIADAKVGVWMKGVSTGADGNNFAHVITANVFDTIGNAAGTGIVEYGAVWIDAGCTGNTVTGNTMVGGTPLITADSSVNVIDQMASNTLKGNNSGSFGPGRDLTGTQVTAMLDSFTSSTKGVVPASGGGTAAFLRADGSWAAPAGGGVPGGASTQIQFNDAGALGGDADFVWIKATNTLGLAGTDTGVELTGITTEPAAPAPGVLRQYSKSIAGRMVPKIKGPAGLDTPMQNAFWQNNITMWNPTGATAGVWLGTTGAGAGTYATGLPTTTSLYTGIKRGRWANVVTTTNQVLGQRNTEAMFMRGSVAGQGGFFFFARCGLDIWTNGGRFFGGMHGSTAVVTGEPSATNNVCGFAVDSGDNGAISFLTRDTTGATKAATGLTITSGKGYDLYMFCAPNDTKIGWRIVDFNAGVEVSGSATANLPVSTALLTAGVLASNAALTLVNSVQLGLNRIYVETDY